MALPQMRRVPIGKSFSPVPRQVVERWFEATGRGVVRALFRPHLPQDLATSAHDLATSGPGFAVGTH
jgi:hypothetical protein